MRKIQQRIANQPTGISRKPGTAIPDGNLGQLAFNNAAQANIVIIVKSGKIIMANKACCRLLGYSQKELLTRGRADIFDVEEKAFKKMLKQRTAEGKSQAVVFAIRKNGKLFSCEITSAVFTGTHGMQKSITSITDITGRILEQKNIDSEKEKLVADNITTAVSRQKAIDIKKAKIVANNIVLAKSKQKAIDVKQQRVALNNIILAKTRQQKIDLKKEKIVAENIVIAQLKSNELLADNNEWIKSIATTSYDVMWDWDIASQQIYVGESINEVFGYKLKKNIMAFKNFCKCLVDEEKNSILASLKSVLASADRTWKSAFQFKRRNGSVAFTTCRASIVRDGSGRAIRLIGALQDISMLQELEQKLREQVIIQEAGDEKSLLAAKLSFDVMWDWNLETNEVFIGEGFEELFGYVIKDNKGDMITNWANHMHPEDKKGIEKELYNTIHSTSLKWEHSYRVIRADSSIAKVFTRASIVRDTSGKALRMIGAMQDLSRQKELEEELDHVIKLKEKQITEATEDAKEMERSNIGKELHDNINQLLGASRMYLEMAKKAGPNSAMYLSRSSEYTLTAIEEIRKLSKGLSTDIIKNLGLSVAIDTLAIDMSEVNPVKISCSLDDFNEKSVTEKFKLNLFRIVQEQLNNILKHAKATQVNIKLLQKGNTVRLDITDNGVGFDTAIIHDGIGLANIKSRAKAYNGIADFMSQPGNGCELIVRFPIVR